MSQRQCMFWFPEGDVLLTFPEPMSVETVESLDECLRILFRGFWRRAVAVRARLDGDAEYTSWQHAEAVPVDATTAERIDASLGLVTLPPIRLSPEVLAALQAKAHAAGVIVQALVREMLNDASGVDAAPKAVDGGM